MKLKTILFEGIKENLAIEFLSNEVKSSPFKGKVFLAGGAPRDLILDLPIKDIDLVIEFENGGIAFAQWICRKLGIYSSANPVVFERFGTAKFNLRGIKYKGEDLSNIDIECVMTRKEKYNGLDRKPDVSPGTLKDDAERRDFTVNSLMKDLTTGEILDLTGKGKDDIKNGVIRSAIDPNIIFKEDPLRMLRAIRFTVKYNWTLPLYMIKAMKMNAHMLKNISFERIQDELNKMIVTNFPDKAIRLMEMTGILSYVMPEIQTLKGVTQNKYHSSDAYFHTLDVLKGVPANIPTRLAALFHDVGKYDTKSIIDGETHFYHHEEVGEGIAREVMTRLKYPNNIIDAVCTAVREHMRLKGAGFEGEVVSDKALRKLQNDLGNHLEMTLDLMHSDNSAHADDHKMELQIPGIRARLTHLKQVDNMPKILLPIDGFDIQKELGIKPGPIIKVMLDIVKNSWFENPHITKEQAISLIKKQYKSMLNNQ